MTVRRAAYTFFTRTNSEDADVTDRGLSVAELEDDCFFEGLFGEHSSSKKLENLHKDHDERLAGLAGEYKERKAIITDSIQGIQSDYDETQQRLEENESQLTSLRPKISNLQTEFSETKAAKRQTLINLFERRRSYPLRTLKERNATLKDSVTELLSVWKTQEEELHNFYANKLELAAEKRALNEEEYSRRTQLLTTKQQRVESDLDEVSSAINSLRKLGVTRTTFKYLLWAAYLAFPIVGWLLGEAIRRNLSSGDSIIENLVSLIAGGLQELSSSIGTLTAIGTLLLAPIVLGFIVVLVVFLSDLSVNRFDGGWMAQKKNRKSRDGRKSYRPFNLMGFSSPPQELTRRDYKQLLARLPMIYAWMLIPISLSILFVLADKAVQGDQVGQMLVDPWEIVFYTFVGTVLSIIIAGFVLLYAMNLIEGRREKYPKSLWRQNWEIGTLAILLVALTLVKFPGQVLLGEAALAEVSVWSLESGIGATLLTVLVGFVLAYGMIYKGLFSDQTAMRRQLEEVELVLEKYSALPAIGGQDDIELENYRDQLEDLHEKIEEIWDVSHVLDEELVGEEEWGIRNVLNKASGRRYRRMGRFVAADYILEPELVFAIDKASLEEVRLEADISSTRDEVSRLESQITQLKDLLRDLRRDLHEERERLITVEKEYHERRSSLLTRLMTLSNRGEVAFNLGREARTKNKSFEIEESKHVYAH